MNSKTMTKEKLAAIIDQTVVTPNAVYRDFDQLCEEAIANQIGSIAVSPCMVKYCHDKLQGSGVQIACSISFQFGRATVEVKRYEMEQAITDGADILEYVMNIGECKSGNLDYIKHEMQVLTDYCHSCGNSELQTVHGSD